MTSQDPGSPADVDDGLATGRYVTTSAGCARLGHGVHPTMVRDWVRRPSVSLDVVRDTAGRPVRRQVPGRRGRENVLPWDALHAAEIKVRLSGRGRPRRQPDDGICPEPAVKAVSMP